VNIDTTESQPRCEDFDWNAFHRASQNRGGDLARSGTRLFPYVPRRVGAAMIGLVFSGFAIGLSFAVGVTEVRGPSTHEHSVVNRSASAAKEAKPPGYTQGTPHRNPVQPIVPKAPVAAKNAVQNRTIGPASLGGPSWSVKQNKALNGLNGTTVKHKP